MSDCRGTKASAAMSDYLEYGMRKIQNGIEQRKRSSSEANESVQGPLEPGAVGLPPLPYCPHEKQRELRSTYAPTWLPLSELATSSLLL